MLIYISFLFRQCICCFRDPKNYERFHSITQSIILLVVKLLKAYKGKEVIEDETDHNDDKKDATKAEGSSENKNEVKIVELDDSSEKEKEKDSLNEMASSSTSESEKTLSPDKSLGMENCI